MINTVLLKPETFIYTLASNGKKIESEKVFVPAHGFFNRKDTYEMKVKEYDTYKHDVELLRTFPSDIQKQIINDEMGERGYYEYYTRGWSSYSKMKQFRREFDYTLNDFYKTNNITKENLINIEYCMETCKDECTITGAYITWDNNER